MSCKTQAQSATPNITPPVNYGHYCSIKYPGGGWFLWVLNGNNSTPCENVLASNPGGTIAKAGLWDTTGQNNVLLTCDRWLLVYRGTGYDPIKWAYDGAAGQKNCTFTVAPTKLPIFSAPYGKTFWFYPSIHTDVARTNMMFNYNVFGINMNRTMFGQPFDWRDPNAHWIDRYGKYRPEMHEPFYDFPMPAGKPLLAMAPGRVLKSEDSPATTAGCGGIVPNGPQKQIFIEHQVGTGLYAEKFVTYYAHLTTRNVFTNQLVSRGQQIGTAGKSGCATGNHLHLAVWRTTNLSGKRFWNFTPDGKNGWYQGVIDPFGWAGPAHVDPWGWMYQGQTKNDGGVTVTSPGAFSINLWAPGAAPPIALF